jgi:carbon monoxide dehydrogenase subunit G
MTERQLESRYNGRRGLAAIVIERSRVLDASPEQVYAALSDPQGLGRLLPRVSRLRIQPTGDSTANLTTWMLFPVIGEVQTEGELSWQANREVVYRSHSTLPVTARWTIQPHPRGALLTGELDLNLLPLLGPMAAFVPEKSVQDVMARELEKALDALEQAVAAAPLPS